MRLLLLLTLLLGACAVPPVHPPLPQIFKNAEIHQDTVWDGSIVIDGTVKVFKGATLTIRPGSDISFVRRDLDRDGLGDAVLIVEGSLLAEGTRARPIRFRSAETNPQPGDWLEIRVDFSRQTVLRYCEISDSAYTLHAHFTKGRIEDCTIRHNIDGSRLGQARFIVRNNLIEHNQGKGINFRNSSVEITRNIIRHNGSGIFLFENDRELSIHHNNLYGNLENFRLGDFYTGNVQLQDNWWGTADPTVAALSVFDRKQDPAIGTVLLKPAPAWVANSGPRDAVTLEPRWNLVTGGYVDSSVVTDGNELFVGSWDGSLYALDPTGKTLWSRELGEVIDSVPAVDEHAVYVQTWGRRVWALDRAHGGVRWTFEYPPSRADDHRQGGLARVGGLLLVPAWNGTLYALDPLTGKVRWQFAAGQPLRSTVAEGGDRLYVASGSGTLSAVSLDGSLLWQVDTGRSLLATPAITPDGPVVVDRDGRVSAYTSVGESRWQRELGETCYYGAPLYADDALFLVSAGGSLWKLNGADGQVVWRRKELGPVYATPRLLDGRLLVGDNLGRLHVVGVDSGDLLTRWTADGAIQSTPVFLDDLLVFGARDQRVYALELLDRPLPAAAVE